MSNIRRHILLLFLLTFMDQNIFSQEVAMADMAFLNARNIAFEGNWQVARDSLEHLLRQYPQYTDAKVLIAKTYSWNGEYEEARKRFNRITSLEKQQKDAWLASIKNEIYAKNMNIALGLAIKALLHLPDDIEIQQLRDKIVVELNKVVPIQDKLKEENKEKLGKNQIGVSSDIEVFDIIFDPMHQIAIEYQRDTKYGKVLPRVNYAQRFNITGAQFEIDAYPTISRTFHGYVNYGYSDAIIFPKHRGGLELYAELPKALEVSVGMRYVNFEDTSATMLTGSFGMYRGNYYLSARPFISIRIDGQVGMAGNILARKYGRDGNHFLGLRANYGFDAELNQFIVDGELLSETQLYLESQQLQFEYQFANGLGTNVYRLSAGLRRQELFFESGSFFWAVSAGLNYKFRF